MIGYHIFLIILKLQHGFCNKSEIKINFLMPLKIDQIH